MDRFKIVILFSVLSFIISCNGFSQKPSNVSAIKNYEQMLSIVEKSINGNEVSSGKLNNTIATLENLTNIQSYIDHSDYGSTKIPVKYNLQDWKLWLDKNKVNLYLKKGTQKIIAKPELSLVKNPQDLFLEYLQDLEIMIKKEEYNIDEINYILNTLESITKYKEVKFSPDCNCRLPNDVNLNYWRDWYNENKHLLYWDDQEQKVKVKKE